MNQGTIKRQVVVEGNQVAFEAGETVEIESTQPNLQNPAFKYVVLSQRLQRRFQLSDDDIQLIQVQQSCPPEVLTPQPLAAYGASVPLGGHVSVPTSAAPSSFTD
jgi:hypothetical protein